MGGGRKSTLQFAELSEMHLSGFLLATVAALALCADACHGSAGFWEMRLCRSNATVPRGDGCVSGNGLLGRCNVTARDILQSPRDATNAWMLLGRQLIAAQLNRLDESRYESSSRGAIADFYLSCGLNLFHAGCQDNSTSLPYRAANSSAVLVEIATRLASYNHDPTAYDLNWQTCSFGAEGEDGWDRAVFERGSGDDNACYLDCLPILPVLGLVVLIAILAIAISYAWHFQCSRKRVYAAVVSEDDFEDLEVSEDDAVTLETSAD